MNFIELYNKDGSVSELINADFIRNVAKASDGRVLIVTKDCNFESYETLEHFKNRTGDQWIKLNADGGNITVRKNKIVAYREWVDEYDDPYIAFWLEGDPDVYKCSGTERSFECILKNVQGNKNDLQMHKMQERNRMQRRRK